MEIIVGLLENWAEYVVAAAVLTYAVVQVYNFCVMPSSKQKENVKEWLRYIVIEAEKIFGSGTGVIKLRWVYEEAVVKFPWVAKWVTFGTFSIWVDDALVWMKEQLDKNNNIASFVSSEE